MSRPEWDTYCRLVCPPGLRPFTWERDTVPGAAGEIVRMDQLAEGDCTAQRDVINVNLGCRC